MTLLHVTSIAICILLGIGIYRRHHRKFHMKILSLCFLLDVSLVLWIEVERMAVEQALALKGYPAPGPLLTFHIIVSVIVLLLYTVQLLLGLRLNKGQEHLRKIHRVSGINFVVFRLTNLVTSFII